MRRVIYTLIATLVVILVVFIALFSASAVPNEPDSSGDIIVSR